MSEVDHLSSVCHVCKLSKHYKRTLTTLKGRVFEGTVSFYKVIDIRRQKTELTCILVTKV